MTWLGTATVIVSLIAGITGTAFGIYNFVDNRRAKRPRIDVTLDVGDIITAGTPPIPIAHFMALTAVNRGTVAVTLTNVCILLPNGRELQLPYYLKGKEFPRRLASGDTCNCTMSAEKLAAAVKGAGYGTCTRLRARYRGALGTSFYSKSLAFDPEQYKNTDEMA